ncbi:hypothetical protein Tco_0677143 [Tanacetum coccineum]
MSMEALQAQEDLMKSIESFLKKFNRISFGKTPKVLLHAWDNFIEVNSSEPEDSKGVPKVCDVPFHDNSPPFDISKDQSEDFSDSNVDSTSTDEDSFSSNDVEIEDDILLIKDDTLREKLLNVNRLVAKIEALKDNPVPSSVVVTKSTSTFPNLFLEETNTFDNSLPELETFCFNLEEPSSGSPTTHSELSLPDYKAF